MAKKLLLTGTAVVALLFVVLLGLAIFLNANQFRPTLESMLSDATGRKVTIGNLKISWLSGGIVAENVAIADDPAFSRSAFVTAKSVAIGVELIPLIFSRSLHVEAFTLDHPTVALARSRAGVWNFSSFGGSSSSSGSFGAMSLLIQRITIAGGQVSVSGAAGHPDRRTYDDVDIGVSNVSLTSRFPFTLSVKMPKGGTAKVDGEVGPLNMKNMAETPFRGAVTVKHLDIASTGFVDPDSGINGVLDFTGELTSDGVVMTTKGKVSAEGVQLLPGGAASRVPIAIDYESAYNTRSESGTLKQGDVHIGKAVARVTGSYRTSGKTPSVQMTLVGRQMPITDLEAALPAIGVTLPPRATFKQGTVDADLAISGPSDQLTTTGPVTLSKGTLDGFDLGGKLGALAAFAGLPKGGDTVIETLGATLHMTPVGLQIEALNIVAPAIGTLTGDGAIAPAGSMNFAMLAKVKEGASGNASGALGRVTSFVQANGIPFRIEGTTSNPSFVPDPSRAAKDAAKQAADNLKEAAKDPANLKKAADAISGLFRRKQE